MASIFLFYMLLYVFALFFVKKIIFIPASNKSGDCLQQGLWLSLYICNYRNNTASGIKNPLFSKNNDV